MISDTPIRNQAREREELANNDTTLTLGNIPMMDTSMFQRWILGGPLEGNPSVKIIDFFEDEGKAVLTFETREARDVALEQIEEWKRSIPDSKLTVDTGIRATGMDIMNSPVIEKLEIPVSASARKLEKFNAWGFAIEPVSKLEGQQMTLRRHCSNWAQAQSAAQDDRTGAAGISSAEGEQKEGSGDSGDNNRQRTEKRNRHENVADGAKKVVKKARSKLQNFVKSDDEADIPFILTLTTILIIGVIATVAW